MADPNEPRPGDTEVILLRKMLARLAGAVGGGSIVIPSGLASEATLTAIRDASVAAANAVVATAAVTAASTAATAAATAEVANVLTATAATTAASAAATAAATAEVAEVITATAEVTAEATQASAAASEAAAASLEDIAAAVPVANPFFLEGLEGNLNGQIAKSLHIKGKRAGFTAPNVLQDVAEFLGPGLTTLPELNGTENLEVVSNHAQDSAAGTGVRSVRIVYLDTSNSLAQTPPIILNGLTAVPVPPKAKAILWMQGTTGGADGVAAGNIILRVVGGATHEQITAGDNRSFSARFVVPLGFTAYIALWQNTSIGAATQDARLRAQVNEFDRTLSNLYVVQDHAFVGENQGATNQIPWLRFPALCKIKVSTVPSAAAPGNRIDTDFSLLLVAD